VLTRDTPAELILKRLGISEPKEIDLEAIAWDMGARVRYRPLDGCEARIIGSADRAIITVNSRSNPRRQRFSIGHELGHWHHDRGRVLLCQAEDIGRAAVGGSLHPERIADRFASSLLMPAYIFGPIARASPKSDFQTVRAMAETFDTSRTATAIRLVEDRHFVACLVCHGRQGRKWFTRSPDVPDRWFPREDLAAESFAFTVLFGGGADDRFPRKIGADAWFDRWDAERFEVYEQTIRTGDDEILTLVRIDDEAMLR
jgi:hypothetical protein